MKKLKGIAKSIAAGIAAMLFISQAYASVLADELTEVPELTGVSDTMSFADLQTLINDAENDDTITLEKDVNWKNSFPGLEAGDSGPLVIPEGRTVTLDLNGHTIDRGLKDRDGVTNANVITVSGNLTLTDGSADGTGKLTGGYPIGDGGGVFIDENATFTMEGGSITDCSTISQGGGVNVKGTFNMTGGTISDCTANNGAGGGVKVSKGTFNMTGGTISGCDRGVFVDGSGMFNMSGSARIDGCTYFSGGGVYVNGGTFTMEGSARITGCTATNGADDAQGGGGVYVDGGTFNVSGSPVISGNKKGDKTNNVTLNGSKTITVTGALTTGAEIRVAAEKGAVIAKPGTPSGSTTEYTITAADAAKFHSDKGDFTGAVDGGNVVFKETLPTATLDNTSMVYDGSAFSPTISFEGATLTKDSDYALSYKMVVDTQETALSSTPKDAGSYKLVVTGKGGYAGKQELDFTITQKPVTVVSGITVKDKEYDGGITAELITTGAVFEGKCDGDTLTVSDAGAGTFADKDAGESKDVNIDTTKFVLGGASSGNYVLAASGHQDSAQGRIRKKSITITGVTVADKEYDGNTTATTDTSHATVTGLVGTDTVTFTVAGAFADANKGNNKTVALSDWNLISGGTNYEIDAVNSQATTSASITGVQVYIDGISVQNKVYDGNETATVTGTAILKKVNGNDTVSALTVSDITAEFEDRNAGENKTVSITGGTLSDAENYTLVPEQTTGLKANITPASITITGLSADNKAYDRTTEACIKGTAVISGKIGNDAVAVSAGTAAFKDANVGTDKTVSFNGFGLSGTDAKNYTLSAQPTDVSANISKRSLKDSNVKILTIPDQYYTGSEITPEPVVKCLGITLKEGEDYTLSYDSNTDMGTATVYVTGIQNCDETISQNFRIGLRAFGTVTVAVPGDKVFGTALGAAPEVTATASLDGETVTVYYSSSSAGTGKVWDPEKADLNAGTYYVWAEVAQKEGEGGHAAARSALVSFKVQKLQYGAPDESILPQQQAAGYDVTVALPAGAKNTEYEYAITGSTADEPAASSDVWSVLPVLTDGKFTITGQSVNSSYKLWLRRKADANHEASAAISRTYTTPDDMVILTYDANGGSGTVPAAEEYSKGGTVAALADGSSLSRYGCHFAGWKRTPKGSDALSGGFTIDSSTILYAHWLENQYTLSFDANGGRGSMAEQTFSYGFSQDLTQNSFTRNGYCFAGWATSAGGEVVYQDRQNVKNLASKGTVTLYAVWVDESWQISGEVKEGVDQTAIQGISVKLMRGKTQFGTVQTTDVNGHYSFSGVPAGIYNLVATRRLGNDKEQTVTELVEVTSGSVDMSAIVMPDENINSEIKVESGTPAVMVGGLDAVAAENAEENKDVTVTMTVETKSEDQAEGSGEIRQLAEESSTDGRGVEIDFLDISIGKTIGEQTAAEPVTETSAVVELIIPFSFIGKKNLQMLRFHEGEAKVFQMLGSRPAAPVDGTWVEDFEHSRIFVYSSLFSTFAVGYESSTGYMITFLANGGTGEQYIQDIAKDAEMPVALTSNAFSRSGYSFSGWNTEASGNGTSYSNEQRVTLNSDLVLYAQWEQNSSGGGGGRPVPPVATYTVSFDMGGHGTTIPSQTIESGKTVTKPTDPTAEGFVFTNWYTEAACENVYDFSTPVTGNITLYAGWREAKKCSVSFNMNGKAASDVPETQQIVEGKCAVEPAVTPKAEGFKFAGWYAEAECENLFDFNDPIKADTIIYAKWIEEKAETFTVTFDLNGKPGTVPSAQTVEKDKTATEPGIPKAEGFTFTGWYKEKDCRTKYDFATPVTADFTLYAGWESGEPVIIETGSDWNLYEDASVHEFKIRGINVNGTVANSNAKSKAYYDANISGSTITVKVTGDRKKAASNAALEFDLGNAGVATYVLPVSYVKPSFKLSSTTATIKSGTETVLKTTILTKNSDGIFEPYDMTDVKVSGTGLGTVTKAADGSIEIKTNAASKGKISIVKDTWDGAKPVSLAYTVKGSKKDVLSVDLKGLKTVVVNSNAKGQVFNFDMMLNGTVPAEGAVKIVDRKSTGLATTGEGGKLLIVYKDGVKNGTYTITLQAGEAKTNVKVKVSSKALDKAVTAKVQTKYDVVTRQGMVVIPVLKDVSGTIEAVSVAESGFTARLNTAGNIVVDYTGDKYNSKNLNIGTLTLSLKLNGIDEPVMLTLNNVKAKKTTPTVKAGTVTIPKDAETAEGKVIGTANIVSTYKVSSGTYKTISPVKTEIVGTPKNVTAKPNESDMTEIDIYSISKKNVSFKVKLTYAGGVTKTVTVKVKKK